MAVEINKVDVWVAQIEDRAGTLAGVLEAIAAAGADLEFVVARRAPESPGTGVVFLAPLRGVRQTRAAAAVGLAKATTMHSLRLEAANRAGLSAEIAHTVGDAGINMRGLSAAAIGKRCVFYFAFDSDADAKKAASLLRKKFGRR